MKPTAPLAAIVIMSCIATAHAQTTWYVDVTGAPPGTGTQGDPYVSIQHAIDAATTLDGDTVLVAPGNYVERLNFNAKYLFVRATAGPLDTTLRPPSASDLLVVTIGDTTMSNPPAELEGFTILRDVPGIGTGVFIPENSQGRLVRCIVTRHGVGIENTYDVFLQECTVTGNSTGITGSSLGIHHFDNTICNENTVRDFFIGAFGPCVTARYSNLGAPLPFNCGQDIGNFNSASSFWNAPGGDFRLRSDSSNIDAGNPADPLDPDGSTIDVGALTFDPSYAPGTGFSCAGTAALCPCGNGGTNGAGCDLAQGTGGIAIGIQAFLPDGAGGGTAEVLGSGYPVMSQPGVTLIRSTAPENPPVLFGDGLRCIAAPVVRVGATLGQGGTSTIPVMHGAGAGTFVYQLWVRNTPIMFCNPTAAFNLSDMLTIEWP
jgi:uncharacterized protein YdeI (BOF family)